MRRPILWVWQLSAPERAATPLRRLKESILRRSGANVDDYKLSAGTLQEPIFPPVG